MPRDFTGSTFWCNGTGYVRVSLPTGRKGLPTPARDDTALEGRHVLIVEQAKRLLDAGFTEEAPKLLEELAKRDGEKAIKAAITAIDILCAGSTTQRVDTPTILDFEHSEVDYTHYTHRLPRFSKLREGDWLINCVRNGNGFDVWPPGRFLGVESYPRAKGKQRFLVTY
ncbi:MAG TPA: hypothetical protein VHC69_09020 [Polyangiaceae bacterium]|nr:hypothetical protein [Polyangiaceae bacterium]